MKIVDWTQKPRKNKIQLPFWRRKPDGSPPKFRENRYASKLMKMINEGKAKLDSVNVLKDFENCPAQKANKKKKSAKLNNEEESKQFNMPRPSSSGYRSRNFTTNDHRKDEYNTTRRHKNKSKGDRKRGGNQQMDANRQRFINENSESSDSDSQAYIPKDLIQ